MIEVAEQPPKLIVELPAEIPDRGELCYVVECLLWPFNVRVQLVDGEAAAEAVRVTSDSHQTTVELGQLRAAFRRLSGADELQYPRDRLNRLDEGCLRGDYSWPDLSHQAWQLVRQLTGCTEAAHSLGAKLRVHLTHDVDRVNPYEPMGLMRRLLAPTRGVGPGLVSRVHDLARWLGRAPSFARVFDRMTEAECAAGARGVYFCMSGPYSWRRTGARTGDVRTSRHAAKVLSAICRNGHRPGLHGCAYSLENDDYHRQRVALETAAEASVTWHRNHYLVWDPQSSPSRLETAGFKVDSTLGFNTRQGFRAGLAWPYRLWDWNRNQPSQVVEIPLVFMDSAGVIARNGPTWEELYVQLERAAEVGGEVAINFHPEYFQLSDVVMGGYRACLSWLSERGAVAGRGDDVGPRCDITRAAS